MIKKEAALYDRDEEGKLLPVEVKVEIDETDAKQLKFKGERIKITPLPRGEIKRIFATVSDNNERDFDGEIILEHCYEPKFTEDEIAHIKPTLATIIVNTIFRESGLGSDKNKKKAAEEAEDEFAKN